jgi:crossover junction endodeoxyribonuclease RusA
MIVFSCTLPFPPSVNSLYGGGSGQKRFKSKTYKAWEVSCSILANAEGCLAGIYSIKYTFYLPDKRKRDLTNYLKAPEDYLVSQCILLDDNHEIVQRTVAQFGGIDKGNPRVEIEIEKL